ncbi:MAG: glucokinase [Burkholderiaceae bacterium]
MTAADSFPCLVADIGATNARFALIERKDAVLSHYRQLASADFADLAGAITQYYQLTGIFADGAQRPRRAALAIATTVSGDWVSMTNQRWAFSIEATRQRLGFDQLRVMNDFTALAMALPLLQYSELHQVGGGEPVPDAPLALIGPGTGLGVSGLIPCGSGWVPLRGEGGHATFSPANQREVDILALVRRDSNHVSCERLVSGSGLIPLYRAIAALQGIEPEALSTAQISARALDNSCPACVETIATFCAMLGTVAGNLVLTLGAQGGVYIGGGIVPRLGSYFETSPFRRRFEEKGRFSDYLSAIPCYVILAPDAALRGAFSALA